MPDDEAARKWSGSRLAFPSLLPRSDKEVIRRGRQSLPESPDRLLGPSLRVCVVAEELVVRVWLIVFWVIPTMDRGDRESRRPPGDLLASRLRIWEIGSLVAFLVAHPY